MNKPRAHNRPPLSDAERAALEELYRLHVPYRQQLEQVLVVQRLFDGSQQLVANATKYSWAKKHGAMPNTDRRTDAEKRQHDTVVARLNAQEQAAQTSLAAATPAAPPPVAEEEKNPLTLSRAEEERRLALEGIRMPRITQVPASVVQDLADRRNAAFIQLQAELDGNVTATIDAPPAPAAAAIPKPLVKPGPRPTAFYRKPAPAPKPDTRSWIEQHLDELAAAQFRNIGAMTTASGRLYHYWWRDGLLVEMGTGGGQDFSTKLLANFIGYDGHQPNLSVTGLNTSVQGYAVDCAALGGRRQVAAVLAQVARGPATLGAELRHFHSMLGGPGYGPNLLLMRLAVPPLYSPATGLHNNGRAVTTERLPDLLRPYCHEKVSGGFSPRGPR